MLLTVDLTDIRSDILCYPNRYELPKHFLRNFLRKYKEDQWIIRLDTIYPHGLNMHLSDFGLLYSPLFK